MDMENEIVDNKGRIRMNELRIQAIINLLSTEGVFTKEEAEKELDKLLEKNEDES